MINIQIVCEYNKYYVFYMILGQKKNQGEKKHRLTQVDYVMNWRIGKEAQKDKGSSLFYADHALFVLLDSNKTFKELYHNISN